MANIREVAKLANVSIATVSRVINGSENVSEETRKKVFQAMKKLNYKAAPSFKDATNTIMYTIGLLLPDIRGYHYSDIVMAIEEYAYTKNFDIMVALPKWEADAEQHVLDQYFRRKVDGIILGELFGGQKLIECFKRSGVPIVFVDFVVDEIDFDVVNVDNIGGSYSAIKYLYEHGHRNILFIPGPEQSPAALDREKGIRKFLERHSLKNVVKIYYGEHRGYNSEHGWVSVTRHLQQYGLNFTAIFAINDWAA
ncbi:MAG: LacI family DNA-binding transcriptional regulator, partial [Fervidobacterium sp.]